MIFCDMIDRTARNQFAFRSSAGAAALVCGIAGAVVFQFFGNATQGYIHSRSLFVWWGSQWLNPAAEMQHGLLVLLAAGWLFWRNLRIQSAATKDVRPTGEAPLTALLAGLALHLVGFALQQSRLSIVALLVFVWGVLALAGGRRWGRAAVFPLGFMLLAVPVNFIDSLGFNLRLVVANQTFVFAHWFGVPLMINGTQLFSPDGRFQYDVAAACSGIRSLVALLALALLVGYIGFRAWLPRVVLAVVCLPYVIVGNIVRLLAIIFAAKWFGQAGGERVHDGSGVIVFLVVLGLLLGTVALLRRVSSLAAREGGDAVETKPATGEENGDEAGCVVHFQPWSVAALTLVLAFVVGVTAESLGSGSSQSVAGVRLAEDGLSPVELPAFVGTEWVGRRVDVTALEREVLPADTGYSRRNYVAIGDLNRQVFVSVVLSGRDRTSIHRPELCLVGQGWSIDGRFQHDFQVGGMAVPATVLRVEHDSIDAQGGRRRVHSLFAYWFAGGESVVPTHWQMQLQDVLDRVRHFRADRWAYVVVQSGVSEAGEAGEAAALARMQEITAGVWPAIECGQSVSK